MLDANPGPGQGAADFFPAKIGTEFVYEGNDGTTAMNLGSRTARAAGTHMIKDIDPGSDGSNSLWLHCVEGQGLFRRDGWHRRHRAVRHGRHECRDPPGQEHQPSRGRTLGSNPQHFHALGNELLFSADDGTHGRSCGRPTVRAPERSCSRTSTPGGNLPIQRVSPTLGSHMYFAATDNVHEGELWRTDGTAAGTIRVSNIEPFGPLARQHGGGIRRQAVLLGFRWWHGVAVGL